MDSRHHFTLTLCVILVYLRILLFQLGLVHWVHCTLECTQGPS